MPSIHNILFPEKNNLLSATGTLVVDEEKKRIVVNLSDDFVNYYFWFVARRYWIKMNKPLHGAHITISSSKYHPEIDWQKAAKYNNQIINFKYDNYIIEGGFTKGFIMYYLKVFSAEIEEIKREIGAKDNDSYKGLHVSIANSKNGGIAPDWLKMIEIGGK